ncbi:hypothetical protein PSTT_14243 [Puccinia striiformis]|uniref:60S ribosomal export protein NMD3 n=1 Tax=Puccinia striiformis TaxID=27350 RepID=A0A2S4UN67_9BASI|nr:hypothetical protein PSTT_14243 [Puccinia striiformis]
MEIDAHTTQYVPVVTQVGYVLCADCGTEIEPNSAGRCVSCLRNTIDITAEIPKQNTLSFCRNCSRYLSPPSAWLLAELESKELLAICLRRLKGLSKVRLVDAGFIWTEPHSKRLRVKLTVQQEVLTSTVLQQIFEVDESQRTFLYLEQIILKHNADKDTVAIKESKDGLDFFYATRQHAVKMVEFLSAIAPVRSKTSEQLISADEKNSTANYKFTYSVELAPICKDDIVCLPPKLARNQGNISQLLACTRVGTSIHLVDPMTLQFVDLSGVLYWKNPFPSLASLGQSIEFVVLDIEPTSHPPVTCGRYILADAQVSPVSSSMNDDVIFHTRTHMGGILKPGDTVRGYHLANSNFNDPSYDTLNPSRIPEIILVRKTYPNRRKKNKPRHWKLKSIAIDANTAPEEHVGFGRGKIDAAAKKSGKGTAEQARVEAEYEMFLRDLEEDPELRQNVQLFKAQPNSKKLPADAMELEDADTESVAETEMDDDDFPKIQLDELLDEMDGLNITENVPETIVENEDEDVAP